MTGLTSSSVETCDERTAASTPTGPTTVGVLCGPGQTTPASGPPRPVDVPGVRSLTSLDPDETSSQEVFDLPNYPSPLDNQPLLEQHHRDHQRFRHSFWAIKRARVLPALDAARIDPNRRARFLECGALAWVQVLRGEHPRYRLVTNRCRDRFCDACASDRRLTIARNLREALPKCELRFLTLTLRASAAPLADQLDRLVDGFARLRRRTQIAARMEGGVYFVEITRNEDTRLWHPHLHALFQGKYLPVGMVKDHWLQITGDSYIVDVRFVRTPAEAASYVTKYASKSLNATVWTDNEALLEAVTSLAGRRLFQPFGSWTKLNLSQTPEDTEGWETYAPLWLLLQKAHEGDPEAQEAIAQLRRREHEPLGFQDRPP